MYKYSMTAAFLFCGFLMTGVGCCCPGFYDNADLKSREVAKEAAVVGAQGAATAATYAYDNRHLLDGTQDNENQQN